MYRKFFIALLSLVIFGIGFNGVPIYGSHTGIYWARSAMASVSQFWVTSVSNVAAVTGDDWSNYPVIDFRGYNTDNDGGGGVFNQEGTTCTVDGGTIIKDNVGTCFVRQMPGLMVAVKWFGAYGDDSHDDTTAIQAWATYLSAGVFTKELAGFWNTGHYKITSNITFTTPYHNIYTGGCTIDSAAITTGPAIELDGGNAGLANMRWDACEIDGSGNSASEGVRLNGAGGMHFFGWHFTNLGVAWRPYNFTAGSFTEQSVCDSCYVEATVTTALQYSVGSGNASFRGTGFVGNSIVNTNGANPAIIIDAAARPYMAPLYLTLSTPTGTTGNIYVVNNQNNSGAPPNFTGNITVEQFNSGQVTNFGEGYQWLFQGTTAVQGPLANGTTVPHYGTMLKTRDIIIETTSAIVLQFDDTTTLTTTNTIGQTVSIYTSPLGASGLAPAQYTPAINMHITTEYSTTLHCSTDVIAHVNIFGNISFVTTLANTCDVGALPPTVSFSNTAVTVTNASWASGTAIYTQLNYPGQAVLQ